MSRTALLYLSLAALAILALTGLGLARAVGLPDQSGFVGLEPLPTLGTLAEPATPPAQARAAVGRPAPDFELQDLEGRRHRLSDYRGQVVLVNFFATWCPPCQAEAKVLERAYETYARQGFTVLGVDLQEDPAAVEAFVEKHGLSFPQLLDRDGETGRRYRVYGLPTSLLIDQQGRVRKLYTGPLTGRILDAWIPRGLEGEY